MSMPVPPDSFRRACGLYPTGVAVVTASHGGARLGMTVNSFTSVSLDPPLVSWSLRSASRARPLLEAADGFAVNILAEDQHHLAERFARSAGDPFDELGLDHAPGVPPSFPARWCRCAVPRRPFTRPVTT